MYWTARKMAVQKRSKQGRCACRHRPDACTWPDRFPRTRRRRRPLRRSASGHGFSILRAASRSGPRPTRRIARPILSGDLEARPLGVGADCCPPGASRGPFPPINVFQQGHDLLAVIEPPGVDKTDLQIQAAEDTIRISGKKAIDYPEGVSLHRKERMRVAFDRMITLPVRIDADHIKAEYRDGMLALFLPRSESDTPRTISMS